MRTDIIKTASERLARAKAGLRGCRPGTEAHSIALREYTSAVKEARLAGCASGMRQCPKKRAKKDVRAEWVEAVTNAVVAAYNGGADTYAKVAEYLNSLGFKTPTGLRFTAQGFADFKRHHTESIAKLVDIDEWNSVFKKCRGRSRSFYDKRAAAYSDIFKAIAQAEADGVTVDKNGGLNELALYLNRKGVKPVCGDKFNRELAGYYRRMMKKADEHEQGD